jgi:hypothetical protein
MSDLYAYGFGATATGTDLYVVATEAALDDKDVEHGVVFESAQARWTGWSVTFRVAALAYAAPIGTFFLIGQNGDVEATTAAQAWDEAIDPSSNGPGPLRPINAACVIGRHVYAAGMRRQVYRRPLDERSWSRFDSGCFVDPAGSSEIVGFNAIHGNAESEFFAVGLHGEIWCCEAGRWSAIDSPTDTSLHTVRCLPGGEVLVGGGLGVLLRGNAKGFVPIVHGVTEASITGIARFAGRTFVADERGGLFDLVGDKLVPVTALPPCDEGGGQLDSNDSALLYVRHDGAWVFDGSSWLDRSPPDDA